MLDETQYLLICLMEECDEVSQRAAKALRFGLDEVQPGQEFSNRARIQHELNDLMTTVLALGERGQLSQPCYCPQKRWKIAKFMDYSREQGTLA